MYDIIIIGGGPAGLSAGLYASRAGRSVLILERMAPGGQLSTIETIENYPPIPKITGPELAMQFLEAATRAGAELRYEDAVKIHYGEVKAVETNLGNRYETKAIILATGAEPKTLGLPMEDTLKGRGVSYCATCDGALFRGKEVAIVGSSKHAIEEALFLSKHASRVHFFSPFGKVQGVEEIENITVYENATPVSLHEENGLLSAVTVKLLNGEEETISVRGLFVAIGNMPANRLFSEFPLSRGGYIPTDGEMLTSVEGIFAAGDIRDKKLRQIVTAASDGATAAVSALRFLKTR